MPKVTIPSKLNLTIDTIAITPAIAAEWLAANEANRNVCSAHLGRIVSGINSGEFNIVGDSIKYDWNGDLIDGQHRLTAIVKTGKTLELAVVRGYDPEAKRVLDLGKKRSALDVARLQGHTEIGHRDISCFRSMLLPYCSSQNRRNLLTVAQEIELTLKFLEPIKFVTSHGFMRGKLTRTAVAGTISRAYLSGSNHLRLTQFMDLFGGITMSGNAYDSAATRLRESFLSRSADRRRSLPEEFELTQSALKSFIARKSRKNICQVGGNVFETPTLDAALDAIIPGFSVI